MSSTSKGPTATVYRDPLTILIKHSESHPIGVSGKSLHLPQLFVHQTRRESNRISDLSAAPTSALTQTRTHHILIHIVVDVPRPSQRQPLLLDDGQIPRVDRRSFNGLRIIVLKTHENGFGSGVTFPSSCEGSVESDLESLDLVEEAEVGEVLRERGGREEGKRELDGFRLSFLKREPPLRQGLIYVQGGKTTGLLESLPSNGDRTLKAILLGRDSSSSLPPSLPLLVHLKPAALTVTKIFPARIGPTV